MSVRVIAVTLMVLASVASQATAQSASSPVSIGGVGGIGKTWDDESQIGTGVLLGGRIDGRLVGGLRVEGAVDWLRHNRDQEVFRSVGHTTFLTAALKYQFGPDTASGYVLGGPVLAFHSGTNSFEGVSRDVSSTDSGFAFGGGFSGRVGSHFEIGPEARFVMLSTDDGSAPAFAIYGGVRVVLRR